LAIVQRIMESVGGRAWAEATPGGGTTIVLEFTDGGNQP
jgi:signal transduction histidine kinase